LRNRSVSMSTGLAHNNPEFKIVISKYAGILDPPRPAPWSFWTKTRTAFRMVRSAFGGRH